MAAAGILTGCTPSMLPLAVAPPAPVLSAAQRGPHAIPPLPAGSQPSFAVPEPGLDVKIGQMILAGFRGLTAPEDSVIGRNLREQHVGSVVLFDYDTSFGAGRRNIQSPQQVKALTHELQQAAAMPLLIAIDQEGGRISRLKEHYGFPPSVSAAYLGIINDLDKTFQHAETTAMTLAEAGINLNLAPVVDLNVNPRNPVIGQLERSFSAEPGVVSAQAEAFIRAHHARNVLCTLKHFPGHGSSRGDTHYGFVDVTDTWSEAELEPYRDLIQRGLCDAVMTAHIFHAGLDPDWPVTLSPRIIDGLLREELGYDGVVISDDMQMGAISNYYSFEAGVQQAVLAGVDIVSIANNTRFAQNMPLRAANAIRQLVDEGTIGEERIDASYRRIVRLKQRLGADSLQIRFSRQEEAS